MHNLPCDSQVHQTLTCMKTSGNLGSCLAAGYLGRLSGFRVLDLGFMGGFQILLLPRAQILAMTADINTTAIAKCCSSYTVKNWEFTLPKGSKYHYGIYLDPPNTL